MDHEKNSELNKRFNKARETRSENYTKLKGKALQQLNPAVVLEAVERALQAVEAAGIDITADYNTWRNIGFALSDEFGEGGRAYFHRVSRFHPKYHAEDCDRQFSLCLKAGGSGITLGSFFHYIRKAGVQLPKYTPPAWEAGLQDPAFSTRSQTPAPPLEPRSEAPPHPEAKRPRSEAPPKRSAPAPRSEAPGTVETANQVELTDEQMEADWRREAELEAANKLELPGIPDSVYASLPDFLKRMVAYAKSEKERDLLLLGSLGVLSSCLTKVYGVYHDYKVHPNLYLFVTAPASAGKGRLGLCRQLVDPIHRELRQEVKQEKEAYEQQMAVFNASKGNEGEKPAEPLERMLFLPANSSSSGILQLLHHNQGRGLIFETEGDSLSNIFRTDYGDYSDGFRKAFHHENISYFRKTDKEYVSIEKPALSTVLTGTPKQVSSLIKDAENGLFSRFIFYHLDLEPVWENVFERNRNEGITQEIEILGREFQEFVKKLEQRSFALKVEVSDLQEVRFNTYFSKLQQKYLSLQHEGYIASIRRLGLIAYRFMMIFSSLRYMNNAELRTAVVLDEDFENALDMVSVLVKHSSFMYTNLAASGVFKLKTNKGERLLEALPVSFTTAEMLKLAGSLQIPERSARRYLGRYVRNNLVNKKKRGVYATVGI